MDPRIRSCQVTALCVILSGFLQTADGQEPPAQKTPDGDFVQISDQPKTVDPARFIPEPLTEAVSVNFDAVPLKEVGHWIQEHQGLPVLFDAENLQVFNISIDEPITDHLEGAPLYLLLNRLRSSGLAWHLQDDIVHITAADAEVLPMTTQTYHLGDLFDAGFDEVRLVTTIQSETPGPWEELDGEGGTLQMLGDALFVRHHGPMQREVAGLLDALRNHGRQTYTSEPSQHAALRETLTETVSIEFDDVPLDTAVRQLAEQTGAEIRLDIRNLTAAESSPSEPVSLTLADRSLRTVLEELLRNQHLGWTLRDGVLWVTSHEAAEEHYQTAVYDVRDICQKESESELEYAIYNVTSGPWLNIDGEGGSLTFAKRGVLVVRQNEKGHRELSKLLAMYREIPTSNRRRQVDAYREEIVRHFYRVDEATAVALSQSLPLLVQPETWSSDRHPDAPGAILALVPSTPELISTAGNLRFERPSDKGTHASEIVTIPQTVLIIRQTRAVHHAIAELIDRIQRGHVPQSLGPFPGFGGKGKGYFSRP